MADLIYSAIMSLDGYIEDVGGKFDWAAPDEEVHGFVNELQRPVGTYLYGRRMYETMLYWEGPDTVDQHLVAREFRALWQTADKVVYSNTLHESASARTRIERAFDVDEVQRLKASASTDISVGGADLAAQALEAALVDELQLFVVPVIVGGGKRALPDHLLLHLELRDERRFASGVVHLRYRTKPVSSA